MKISRKKYPFLYKDTDGIKILEKDFISLPEYDKDLLQFTMRATKRKVFYLTKKIESHLEDTAPKFLKDFIPEYLYKDGGVLLFQQTGIAYFYSVLKAGENMSKSGIRVGDWIGCIIVTRDGYYFDSLVYAFRTAPIYKDQQLIVSSLHERMNKDEMAALVQFTLTFSVWKKYSEIQNVEVGGGGRPRKVKYKGDSYFNDSDTPVTTVDAGYLRHIEGEVLVKGYFRMQRYGKLWRKKKLVYIEPHVRNYTRRAGKEREEK